MPEITAVISEKDAGRKIKYFVQSDMRVSYHQYKRMKAMDGLRVNGVCAHANYILQKGDVVTAFIDEEGTDKPVEPEDAPVSIVYEDDDMMLIDKSAPLASQCTPKQPNGTLENRILYRFRDVPDFVFRPLNRLDKGTSGLLAAAKHAHAFQIMQKQLHTDEFVREYLAVTEGVFEGSGVIDLPIAREQDATIRRIIDYENGQRAVTHYRVERNAGNRTLVRLRLETGRTHQIRVHMRAIGHPIVGDFLYGTETDELPGRFALHSTYISLIHPMTGLRVEAHSPLPPELERLLHE